MLWLSSMIVGSPRHECVLFVNIASPLPIDKTLSVEAQIGLLWCSFCSSSYRVWDVCGRPLRAGFRSMNPAGRWCENPARALSQAGFSQYLSAWFVNLNPALRGLSLFLVVSQRHEDVMHDLSQWAMLWLLGITTSCLTTSRGHPIYEVCR